MENRGSVSSSLPEPRSSVSESPSCGDEELDEETVNFISALYASLGPLLPEVTKLQGHQDPPAHLMVDMKARLRELGSSVSDARKQLLRYNMYLKKQLARAVQERKVLREQQPKQQESVGQPSPGQIQRGIRTEVDSGKPSIGMEKNILEISSAELPKSKPPERVHRRSVRRGGPGPDEESPFDLLTPMSSPPLLSPTQDGLEDRTRTLMTSQGILQRSAGRMDNMPAHPSLDRALL